MGCRIRHLLPVTMLALLLGVLTLALPGRAQAGEHGDHHHAAAAHHVQAGDAEPAPVPAAPQQSDTRHDGHCHCVSALCAPVLEPALEALTLREPSPLRLDRPASADARPQASVDPPPRPPKA